MPTILDVCRLCGQKKKIKIDVFDGRGNLCNKIRILLNIEVNTDDQLPKVICFECQRNIDQFNSFKNKCKRVQEQLLKILSSPVAKVANIKEEKNEGCDIQEEHNYGAQPSIQKVVASVKRELQFDELPSQSPQPAETDAVSAASAPSPEVPTPSCDADISVLPHASDTKLPIIEIVLDRDVANAENQAICEKNTGTLPPEVKQQIIDVRLPTSTENEDNTAFEVQPCETKLPIAEVVLERNDVSCKDTEVSPVESSKLKVELVNFETKPTVSPPSEDDDLSGVTFLDLTQDNEFDEKDFYTNSDENDACNFDMEKIEAEIQNKTNPNMRLKCDLCPRSFKFYKALQKHRDSHDKDSDVYLCNFCIQENRESHSFKTLASLKTHLFKQHHPENVYVCSACGAVFRTKIKMVKHIKALHITFRCSVCKKIFKTQRLLQVHSKVHSEVKPYVCEVCDRRFRWSTALSAHIVSHTQEKNFLCAECGKTFASKKSLGEHGNVHTGRRPFVCKTCGMSFICGSSMTKHMRQHSEASHRCSQCGKCFHHKYQLNYHTLTHSSSQPFTCVTCNRGFFTQSGLGNHQKVHQDKTFSCEVCGLQFRRSSQLTDHMGRHTGLKHLCPAPGCGKSYSQRFPLSSHFKKSHPGLVIVNRKGGRKPEGLEMKLSAPLTKWIHYGYRQEGDQAVIYSVP